MFKFLCYDVCFSALLLEKDKTEEENIYLKLSFVFFCLQTVSEIASSDSGK